MFKFLRRESSPEEAEALHKTLENDAGLKDDFDSFRAAKALFEEEELFDFKQDAQKYVRHQKVKSYIVKSVIAILSAAAIATGIYLLSSDEDTTESHSAPVENRPPVLKNNTVSEQTVEAVVAEKKEKSNTPVKSEPVDPAIVTIDGPATETGGIIESEKPLAEQDEKKEVDIIPIAFDSTKNKPTIKVAQEDIKKEQLAVEEENKADKIKKESVDEDEPESDEEYVEEEIEDEAEDPCDFYMHETFDLGFSDEFQLIEEPYKQGSLKIVNEFMQEKYTARFGTYDGVFWNGQDKNGNLAKTGVYKVIITYEDGKTCMKDLTIINK